MTKRKPPTLAKEIRAARLAAGLTQADLAQRIGVAQSSISRVEAGERTPSVGFLKAVAVATVAAFLIDAEVEGK